MSVGYGGRSSKIVEREEASYVPGPPTGANCCCKFCMPHVVCSVYTPPLSPPSPQSPPSSPQSPPSPLSLLCSFLALHQSYGGWGRRCTEYGQNGHFNSKPHSL